MSAESAYTWLLLMSATPLTVIKHYPCREARSIKQFCELIIIINSNGVSKLQAVHLIALEMKCITNMVPLPTRDTGIDLKVYLKVKTGEYYSRAKLSALKFLQVSNKS